jgi:hypothetical protein
MGTAEPVLRGLVVQQHDNFDETSGQSANKLTNRNKLMKYFEDRFVAQMGHLIDIIRANVRPADG